MCNLFGCVVALGIIIVVTAGDTLRIGAFNVQVFGTKKASKEDVMTALVKIVQRYDILLIEEIRDISGKAIEKLHELIDPEKYGLVLSKRLGRTNSKEQYAYFYRINTVVVLDIYQWPDPLDQFEREPFAVKVSPKSDKIGLKEFVLAGVHVDPDEVKKELNALAKVHEDLVDHWKTDDVILMGDFNAGCDYLSKRQSAKLLLRDSKYVWLINNTADTTTKSTDCPYDRIIVTGDNLLTRVLPNSPTVFHYDKAFRYNKTMTTAISDHYPVEFELASPTSSGHVLSDLISTLEQLIRQLEALQTSGMLRP